MLRKILIFLVLAMILVVVWKQLTSLTKVTPSTVGKNGFLHLVQTISLGSVEGRIDHLSIDIKGQRLFVAALGNNSVEVVDLEESKVIHSITNLSEPQSALFIPNLNKLFVTNGSTGICQIFDGISFDEISRVELSGDADNIRYDSNSNSVVVGSGDGGLSFINAETGKEEISIKLSGHPESFQLESSGSKIFVNVPSANQIAVVDRGQQKVTATWFMTKALANFPMALDEVNHRLFVGFRAPTKLVVFDGETGKSLASFETVGDVDDIFYDSAHKLIFVIGGEGYIDIFSQQDADHYQYSTRIATKNGARTGLWVQEQNRLYVAVPRAENQEAEIQVYELQP